MVRDLSRRISLACFLVPTPECAGNAISRKIQLHFETRQEFRATKTVLLLICSTIFMTIAWYGHLKYRKALLITVIVVSWLITFAEYCFQVSANLASYGNCPHFS